MTGSQSCLHGSGVRSTTPSYQMLGVRVDALTTATLYIAIAEAIDCGLRYVIANHNLHSIYLYHRDAKMRSLYARAQFVFIDGMPLILIGRLLGFPLRRENRMTSIDWLRPLLPKATKMGWRILMLGSKPGIADRAATLLRNDHPGLEVRGMHGYFDSRPGSEDSEKVISQVCAYRPHILCLGMGMPRQEHWIEDHLDRLDVKVILNLGGFMDLLTGELPIPPRWMSRLGLEWLVRLISRPGRVWRRYLWEPWFLLPLLAHDIWSRQAR